MQNGPMSDPTRVIFVCWGNICRSPMAERVATHAARAAGLGGVEFTSAALSSEEIGNPMDPRARRTLAAHGYDGGGHRAHRITAAEIRDADLVIGMEDFHLTQLRRLVPDAGPLALLTDFDPSATESQIPDPWYGPQEGFEDTFASIEAAMPGVLAAVRALGG